MLKINVCCTSQSHFPERRGQNPERLGKLASLVVVSLPLSGFIYRGTAVRSMPQKRAAWLTQLLRFLRPPAPTSIRLEHTRF